MRSVGWFTKYVILPLAPFIVGMLIRGLYAGQVSMKMVSPGELSFSVAILSLVISTKAAQIQDTILRDALTSLFQLAVIVFLAFFSWAVLVETDIAISLESIWQLAQTSANSAAPVAADSLPDHLASRQELLGRLRWATIVSACVMIPLTVLSVNRYNLHEL